MSQSRRAGARLLWRELRPVKAVAVSALSVLMISVLATLAGPLIVQYFVDLATAGGGETTLALVALAYLAVALVGGATRVAASYLGVHSGWRIADSLRIKLLRRAAVESPILEVESRPVCEVLEKVEGNADIVGRSIAESGFRLIGNCAVALGTLVVFLVTVPAAGIGVSLLVIAVCLALTRLGRVAVRRWEGAREQQADLFGFIGDALAARSDLLPLGESAWATERTRVDLTALFRTERRAYIGGRGFWPLTQLFIALAFGLVFGFSLQRLEVGSISIGTLTAIYLYLDLLQKPLEEMSSQAGQLQQMMAVLAMAARSLESDAVRPRELSSEPLPEFSGRQLRARHLRLR